MTQFKFIEAVALLLGVFYTNPDETVNIICGQAAQAIEKHGTITCPFYAV
jgi:hypothetical protein